MQRSTHMLVALTFFFLSGACRSPQQAVNDEPAVTKAAPAGPGDDVEPVHTVEGKIAQFRCGESSVVIRLFNDESYPLESIGAVSQPNPQVEPQIRCFGPDAEPSEKLEKVANGKGQGTNQNRSIFRD